MWADCLDRQWTAKVVERVVVVATSQQLLHRQMPPLSPASPTPLSALPRPQSPQRQLPAAKTIPLFRCLQSRTIRCRLTLRRTWRLKLHLERLACRHQKWNWLCCHCHQEPRETPSFVLSARNWLAPLVHDRLQQHKRHLSHDTNTSCEELVFVKTLMDMRHHISSATLSTRTLSRIWMSVCPDFTLRTVKQSIGWQTTEDERNRRLATLTTIIIQPTESSVRCKLSSGRCKYNNGRSVMHSATVSLQHHLLIPASTENFRCVQRSFCLQCSRLISWTTIISYWMIDERKVMSKWKKKFNRIESRNQNSLHDFIKLNNKPNKCSKVKNSTEWVMVGNDQ